MHICSIDLHAPIHQIIAIQSALFEETLGGKSAKQTVVFLLLKALGATMG